MVLILVVALLISVLLIVEFIITGELKYTIVSKEESFPASLDKRILVIPVSSINLNFVFKNVLVLLLVICFILSPMVSI